MNFRVFASLWSSKRQFKEGIKNARKKFYDSINKISKNEEIPEEYQEYYKNKNKKLIKLTGTVKH